MVHQDRGEASHRRRNVLRLAGGAGAAGGLGALATPGGTQRGTGGTEDETEEPGNETDGSMDHAGEADGTVEVDGPAVAVRQGDTCFPVTPLSGDQPAAEFYGYTYPRSQFDGPPGETGTTYSSEGTVDLQRERGSVVFLYDGPEGLSLVFVHGKLDEEEVRRPAGESNAGGAVSVRIRGLPGAGGWVVLDDYYLVDGEQASTNVDRFHFTGACYLFHWLYRGGRTDGGVFRGLGEDFDLEVVPAFNDRAELSDLRDYGTVERWEFLSGDREDPDRRSLALDRPLRITSGTCDDEGSSWSDDAEDRPER